jgi:hypothetical protein
MQVENIPLPTKGLIVFMIVNIIKLVDISYYTTN